jgi:hypothetical protein
MVTPVVTLSVVMVFAVVPVWVIVPLLVVIDPVPEYEPKLIGNAPISISPSLTSAVEIVREELLRLIVPVGFVRLFTATTDAIVTVPVMADRSTSSVPVGMAGLELQFPASSQDPPPAGPVHVIVAPQAPLPARAKMAAKAIYFNVWNRFMPELPVYNCRPSKRKKNRFRLESEYTSS